MLPWKPRKMVIGYKTQNWIDNHQMIIIAKYSSYHFTIMEKMQFFHFPSHYKSMGAFCCHANQIKRQITITLAVLNFPYQSDICTK